MSALVDVVWIVVLTMIGGVFAGAELAIISVRRSRLTELAEQGDASAKAALTLRARPEIFLATVQIAMSVIAATVGALGGAELEQPVAAALASVGLGAWASRFALTLVVAMIAFLTVVLGELVPKSLALRSNEALALILARPLLWLAGLARPLVWLLTAASNLVLRPFRDSTTFTEGRLSPDELRQLVEEAADAGTLDDEAGEIAARAIDFSSVRLRAVMVPRAHVARIALDASTEDVRALLRARPHSRYPVLGPGIDDVPGYVIARDVYEQLLAGAFDLRKLLRPCTFLPESMLAVDALRMLQQARSGIGVVVDEAGSVEGLVSVEDLAEELVGDIFAEHEEPVEFAVLEEPGVYLVDGGAALHEVNRALGIDLPRSAAIATIAGLVINVSGVIPTAGTIVELDEGIRAEIVESTPQRIRRIRIRLPPASPP